MRPTKRLRKPFDMAKALVVLTFLFFVVTGCATVPKPSEVVVPEPIEGTEGEYMSPFTFYGTVAPWVEKGTTAMIGARLGSAAGQRTGSAALSAVPIVGGWLGNKAGEKIGREVALKLIGGEEYIESTSDMSFDEIENMIIFLYSSYSDHEEYEEIMSLTASIYPEMGGSDGWQREFRDVLKDAPRKGEVY